MSKCPECGLGVGGAAHFCPECAALLNDDLDTPEQAVEGQAGASITGLGSAEGVNKPPSVFPDAALEPTRTNELLAIPRPRRSTGSGSRIRITREIKMPANIIRDARSGYLEGKDRGFMVTGRFDSTKSNTETWKVSAIIGVILAAALALTLLWSAL